MKKIALTAAVLAAMFAVGCGSDESREDANDVLNGNAEKSAPRVISFNNKYPNVETKCDGFGHRMWVTTGGVFYVLPDPTCQGEGTSYDDILKTNEQPPVQTPQVRDQPPIVVSP